MWSKYELIKENHLFFIFLNIATHFLKALTNPLFAIWKSCIPKNSKCVVLIFNCISDFYIFHSVCIHLTFQTENGDGKNVVLLFHSLSPKYLNFLT